MGGQASSKLTPKQAHFVEEYLIDLNATQAAIRAGYSPKTANEQAAQLLAKLNIAAAVREARNARSQRTEITQDMVLRELAKIGFSDIRGVIRWQSGAIVQDEETSEEMEVQPHGGELSRSRKGEGANLVEIIASDAISDDMAACVSEVAQTANGLKVKLYDKQAALMSIGKHLGMFTDKLEVNGTLTLVADAVSKGRARVASLNGE